MNQEVNLGKYSKLCRICGKDYRVYEKDYHANEVELCPSCAKLKELEVIRQALIHKPSLNVLTLSKETGIPVSHILNYIKEEHIITRE